ncbi:carboxypeptidase-like regulatory domain-containing protein [Myxococcota bacterium]|nr:carboxypeptidase-like regulatory domain-containing protein [Myxococcota bacterium]
MRLALPTTLLSAVLALPACSDQSVYAPPDIYAAENVGAIEGRVCDPSGTEWLENAFVYLNVVDSGNKIVDYLYTYTDRDGRFRLESVPKHADLQLIATRGNSVVAQWTVTVNAGETTRLSEPDCIDPLSLNVAVVTGDYDDPGTLLSEMGFGSYTEVDGIDVGEAIDFVSDSELLNTYDMVFFNGGFNEDGIVDDPVILANIDAYLEQGGVVYVSDWAYDLVESLYPEKLTFVGDDTLVDDAQRGRPGYVDCQVTDPNLATVLGANAVQMQFDLPLWPPVLFADATVAIHMTGTIQYQEAGGDIVTQQGSPVLVSFSRGSGRLMFSSFRVQANDSADQLRIFRYMLFEL